MSEIRPRNKWGLGAIVFGLKKKGKGRFPSVSPLYAISFVFVLSLFLTPGLHAQTSYWFKSSGTNSWHTAANWYLNNTPTSSSTVVFYLPNNGTTTVTNNTTVGSIHLDGSFYNSGSSTIVNAAISVAAGKTLTTGQIEIGKGAGVYHGGNLTLLGGGTVSASSIPVGPYTSSLKIQAGTTLNVSGGLLGWSGGGYSRTWTVETDSVFNFAGTMTLGRYGGDTFTVSGGSNVTSGTLNTTNDSNSTPGGAAISVTGSGSSWINNGDTSIGYSGTANTSSFTVSNGGSFSTNQLFIGGSPNAAVNPTTGKGIFNVGSNGTLSVTGLLSTYTAGTLNISGGTATVGSIDSSGTINLSSGLLTAGSVDLSGSTFNHSGGTLRVDGGTFTHTSTGLTVGGNSAVVELRNGATDTNLTSIVLGTSSGAGQVNILSNSDLTTTTATVGSQNSGSITVSGTGSTWVNSGDINLGTASVAGSLTVSSGGVVTTNNLTSSSLSTVTVDNGTLNATTWNNSSSVNQVGGTVDVGVLNGTNTYSTTGTTRLGDSRSWSLNTSITGTGTVRTEGSGTITLASGSIATTNLIIDAGNLKLTTGNRIGNSTAVTIAPSATLTLATGSAETIGSLAGSGFVDLSSSTLSTGGNNQTTSYSGAISGTGGLVKLGTGMMTLAGNNTYSGGTSLGSGTLNVNSATAIGTGTLTINGGTIDNTSGSSITLSSNNSQVWNSNVTFAGTNNLNLGSGQVTLNGGDRSISLANGSTLTTGRIVSTVGGLSIAGNGKLALSGASNSSLSGSLNVGSGTTLQLNTGSSIGTTADFSAASLAGTGVISNGGGVDRLLIVNGATSSTFGGSLIDGGTGALGLSNRGGGTLNLTGTNNTLTGNVSVWDGGTLNVTGSLANVGSFAIGNGGGAGVLRVQSATANSLGSSSIDFDASGGTSTARLELANSELGNSIGLSGRNNASVAIMNLSGTSSITGPISLNSGGSSYKIQSSSGSLHLGDISVGAGNSGSHTLTLDGAGDGVVAGQISDGSGTVNIAKTGSGTWTLNGINTYTGTTSVSGGNLIVNGNATSTTLIGNGSSVSGSGELGAVFVDDGGTIAPGNSIESLGTANISFGNGSVFAYELDTNSINGDLLFSSGDLNISTGAIITLTELASGSLTNGNKLTLISYAGSWNGGLFSYLGNSLLDDSIIELGSNSWLVNYNDFLGGSNFATDQFGATGFLTITAVPEPSSLVAMLFAMGLISLKRRSKARS